MMIDNIIVATDIMALSTFTLRKLNACYGKTHTNIKYYIVHKVLL